MPPTVAELTDRLVAAGVEIPSGARKPELERLAADLDGDGRVRIVGLVHVAGTWRDDDHAVRQNPRVGEVVDVPAWLADSLIGIEAARLADPDEDLADGADEAARLADPDEGEGEVTEPVVD